MPFAEHVPKVEVQDLVSGPQLFPQPLSPHTFPEQEGIQSLTQVPLLQEYPKLQLPHVPPQLSSPQTLPEQLAVLGSVADQVP